MSDLFYHTQLQNSVCKRRMTRENNILRIVISFFDQEKNGAIQSLHKKLYAFRGIMWTCTFADPNFCVMWREKPLYLSFPLLQENRQISTMEVLLCLKLLLPSTYTVPYGICGTFHSTELGMRFGFWTQVHICVLNWGQIYLVCPPFMLATEDGNRAGFQKVV